MKTLNTLSNIIVALAVLAVPRMVSAQEDCYDASNQAPCHAASSGKMKITGEVSCACAYSSTDGSGRCFTTWTVTTNTTTSLTSNWTLVSGSTYDDTAYDYNPNDCYWTYSVIELPTDFTWTGPCYPTITYDNAGPGARNSVMPGNACGG